MVKADTTAAMSKAPDEMRAVAEEETRVNHGSVSNGAG